MNGVVKWSKYIRSRTWNFNDTVSIGHIGHLQKMLYGINPCFQQPNLGRGLGSGCHFLFCNQSNQTLGIDGYDNYQAPVDENGEGLFNRRMWVKGNIEFLNPSVVESSIQCTENITNVKAIQSSVFVNIMRNFHSNNELMLKESRVLVYTNNQFVSGNNSQVAIATPIQTSTITLTDLDIKKYSFLTYNLHKIHLDNNHCLQEGLGSIVAQGPLLVTLALNFFNHHYPNIYIQKIDYKIQAPVYANRPIVVTMYEESGNYKVVISDATNKVQFTSILFV